MESTLFMKFITSSKYKQEPKVEFATVTRHEQAAYQSE